MVAMETSSENGSNPPKPSLKLKFRNYQSSNPEFQAFALEEPVRPTATAAAEAYAKEAGALPGGEEQWDIFSLAPRKVTWDLERAIEKDMKKLEKRTKAACLELLRRRLAGKGAEDMNLAAAVNATVEEQQVQTSRDREEEKIDYEEDDDDVDED